MRQLYKVAIVQAMLGYALFSWQKAPADYSTSEWFRTIDVEVNWPSTKTDLQSISDSFQKLWDSFPPETDSLLEIRTMGRISLTLALEIKK